MGKKLFDPNRAQGFGHEQKGLRDFRGFETLGQYIKRHQRKIKEMAKKGA